ncbi:MAG: questin oxidase family protein [Limnohabitans sp.]
MTRSALATAAREPSGQLVGLLTAGAAHAPEDADGQANPLPVALVALDRLGAAPERLVAFAQRHGPRLQAAPPAQPWPAGDPWPDRLGRPEAWPAYRALFTEWIEQEGASDMLGQVLPGLMPGVGAAGFQGLIRTASAVRCGHLGALADGLAWWACRHLPLGALHHPLAGTARVPATEDPEALLRELPARRSRQRSGSDPLLDVARDGRVNRVAARLLVDGHTLERLARTAAFAYAHTGNFTALHLVTGTHALRVLTRFLDEPLVAWAWYWQAFAHAVVAARLQPAAAVEPRPWKSLIARALTQDDPHAVTLVESCLEEERAYARRGETLWRLAASRAPSSR